jgi:outer membrane receptor for ferrienterochelin and colicin
MHNLKRLALGAGVLALATAMSSAVFAQDTTGGIHGIITSGGAPAANAAVTITHEPSGTKLTTVTNDQGAFDANGLRVGGPYTITIGARTYNNVFVDLGRVLPFTADLAEAPQETVEAVTVTAGRRDSTQGPKSVLNADQIKTVVSITRDIRDVARRDILVSQDANGSRAGVNAGGISIAGSNPRFNRIAVDGVSAQDNFGLAQGGLTTARGPVTLDAVEQYVVAVAPIDVENGDFTGGSINLVLKSGGNNFHGTAFVNYLNEGMIGKHIGPVRVAPVVTQQNFGGFLSGPIIKDKLFFALSYEKYSTTDATLYGVAGQGYANSFTNLSQATVDQVVNTYNNGYRSPFPLGTDALTQPVLDKKYSAKFDWNINENHRASLSYRYAFSGAVLRTDQSVTTDSLNSHWYTQSNKDQATTLEIDSRWTDKFSTVLRATYRDYRNGQNPPSGQNYADVSVCTATVSDSALTNCQSGFSTVRFGPDQFRHANALDEQEARFSATGTYTLGNHTIKFGGQARKADIFDIFVSSSHGVYYFDSLADFTAGNANQMIYQNAVSGNAIDAAYSATTWTDSIYAQDAWQVTDDIKLTYGFRYDRYFEKQKPALNPNFVIRNGFPNTTNIDGLDMFQPRVGVEWKPTSDFTLTAGGGVFGGGTPDVLAGLGFTNTGYLTNSVTFQRAADGTTINETTGAGGFTQAIGQAALNNLNADPNFGYKIPGAVASFQQGQVAGSTGVPTTGEVIALAPNFKLPSTYKVYLGANYRIWDWNLHADFIATEAHNEITYYDAKAQVLTINGVQQFLPDGRIRYDGLAANTPGKTSFNPGTNRDIIATNVNKGDTRTIAFQASRSWDWGGDLALGYARTTGNDMNPGLLFGTTSSLYASAPSYMDPNRAYLGRSETELERYKLQAGYAKKFFGDYESRFTLFAERQTGRPFGFQMSDAVNNSRSQVFGVNQTAEALYVPDFNADTDKTDLNVGLVTFATQQDRDLFQSYVTRFGLKPGLLQKLSNTNKDVNRVDFQYSQELPSIIEGHKLRLVFDVRNVLNLINRDWGKASEYSDQISLARVSCADGAGQAVAASSAACPRYRYSSVPTTVTRTTNNAFSLWYLQVGLRYEF